ncbi:hypothetical protein GO988_22720 [Hymenobacter sp. HMF4947]|uniref:Uncharacterized protein n=1 Tax=Hymenobacter ginkgonis TaxID=2682976 RepID=A0A7K1TL70_9BACT|nr:hypothetical protein [Hymenobacter ginkgonis]MVN79154.1 hypothetical protein [Hymenobacter ginkgonis]
MRLSLTWHSLLAFGALLFALGEAHALVHTGLGRAMCGCRGTRDFNVWSLCAACEKHQYRQLVATYAGPVFTFAGMRWGYFLLDARLPLARRSLGFALVFANLPFARILGAVFLGGNDEVYALSKFLPYPSAWELGAALVLLAAVPPLGTSGLFAAASSAGLHRSAGALNSLLASGFLTTYGVLGSPLLVTCRTIFVRVLLALTYRQLFTLGQPAGAPTLRLA